MSEASISLLPFSLAGPTPAQASLLWDWSYTGDGIAANGTFDTDSTPDASGYYQIAGITGVRNGETVIGLEPAGDAIPGNPGYPVDNLINAGGQLTVNGFGYETEDGDYANPYYANYLSPPIDQEVFTQATSPVFSEGPITFQAARVPGVTVATVAPQIPTDALKLVVIHAPQRGTLALLGTSVQYMPAGQSAPAPLTFSFEIADRHGSITPVVTVIAAGNGSRTVTGAASGYTDVSLGNGNNTVALHGNGNVVNLGNGVDTVRGGTADTVDITGNTALAISGHSELVFVGNGNDIVGDFSTGLDLEIGPASGQDVLSNFASDSSGVVDLIGGIGGLTTVDAVLSALQSDGHGGTLLAFGSAGSLDFAGMAVSRLHPANFHIG